MLLLSQEYVQFCRHMEKGPISIFFKIRFSYLAFFFAFSIMSEKISLLGSIVSEIGIFYLHFKSKFTRKYLQKVLISN